MAKTPATSYETNLAKLEQTGTSHDTMRHFHQEVVDRALSKLAQRSPVILGVAGSQGSGKSTQSQLLKALFEESHGLTVCILSIDDVYLSKAERHALSCNVHPLLATRGVPGTHNVALAHATLDALSQADGSNPVAIPRFDKATDNPHPREAWPEVLGPVDMIIFEGWCVGARPQPLGALVEPVNQLEAQEDQDGQWRSYVNKALGQAYTPLFERLDLLIMLAAPSFDVVLAWRRKQEDALRAATTGETRSGIMDEAALKRFIMHYQRITEAMLEELPARADCVVKLSQNQQPISVSWKTVP